jgi:hypothetical protein
LLDARAKVLRSEAGVEALQGVRVDARMGQSEQAPTLDAQLSADVKYVASTSAAPTPAGAEPVRTPEVPRYTIDRLNVDLAAAQRDFPEQMAALQAKGMRFDSGVLAMTGSGAYASGTATFDLKGGTSRVNLTRAAPGPAGTDAGTGAPAAAQARPPAATAAPRTAVLRDHAVSLEVAGSHATAGPSAGTRLTRLSIVDNQKMLSLRKGAPDIVLPAGEDRAPTGEVVLGADLKLLLDLSRAMGDDPAAATAEGPPARSRAARRHAASRRDAGEGQPDRPHRPARPDGDRRPHRGRADPWREACAHHEHPRRAGLRVVQRRPRDRRRPARQRPHPRHGDRHECGRRAAGVGPEGERRVGLPEPPRPARAGAGDQPAGTSRGGARPPHGSACPSARPRRRLRRSPVRLKAPRAAPT